jgi:hypothetical protein
MTQNGTVHWYPMLGCQVEDSYPWRDVDGGAPKGVWDEFPSYLGLSEHGVPRLPKVYNLTFPSIWWQFWEIIWEILCVYIYIINQFLNKPNSDLTVLMEFRHCWDSIWDTPELYWAGTFTSDIELQATLCFTPCMTQVFKMLVWEAAPNWKALKCWKHVFSCFFPNLPNL